MNYTSRSCAEIEESAEIFRQCLEVGGELVDIEALRARAVVLDDVLDTVPLGMVLVAPMGTPDGVWYYAAIATDVEGRPALRADRITWALGYAAASETFPELFSDDDRSALIGALGRAVLFPADAFVQLWNETLGDAPAIAARVGCTPELVISRAQDLSLDTQRRNRT